MVRGDLGVVSFKVAKVEVIRIRLVIAAKSANEHNEELTSQQNKRRCVEVQLHHESS